MTRVVRSAFRYPGSKDKIADGVVRWFPPRVTYSFSNRELSGYCEPFIGCGAVAMRMLPCFPATTQVVLGDKDYGIVCLWRIVAADPAPLISMLLNFVPTVEKWQRYKELDSDTSDSPLNIAFRKFTLHQMSFSGLGVKAGGPIGGRKQRSDYPVGCRFHPARHAKALTDQHRVLRRFKSLQVVHDDFANALAMTPDDGFAYLDPPYYVQGGALYKHNMDAADHTRLAHVLAAAPYEWALSYDDCPCVRELYAEWSDINSFEMTASIDTKRGAKSRRKNNELVITKREFAHEAA